MLDVSLRVAVLDLLLGMQKQQQLAYVFVSHDFGVVRYFARGGRIVVMFYGVIVEEGDTETVIASPRHPYTYLLREAIPVPDPRVARRRRALPAEERLQAAPSSHGCIFSNRCPFVSEECVRERPPAQDVGGGQRVACFFPERVPPVSTVLEGSADRAPEAWADHVG
jgi:oligopeptide/dipeptide ABC transporter ATP-binding protein